MPDARVVDTDVVSYMFRLDSRADLFQPLLEGAVAFVSFMTVAEIDRWALARNWGSARLARLDAFLESFSVVLVDRSMCRTWAGVVERARRNWRPIHTADAWIAATALSLGVPLVTNNRDHFLGVDDLVILPNPEP